MTGPDPYQGYPQYEGGGYGPPGLPPPSPPPQPVMYAFYAMIAGAVVQGLTVLLAPLQSDAVRDSLRDTYADDPSVSPTDIDNLVTANIAMTIIFGLISVGLWLWMAFMNRKGRNWARITATVLFALSTVFTLLGLLFIAAGTAAGYTGGSGTALGLVLSLVQWAIGLTAIIMLWKSQSSQYFQQQRTYR